MFSERSARRRRRRRRTPRLLRGLAATGAILLAIGAIGYVGSRIRSSAPAETTSTTGAAVTASRRPAPTTRPNAMTLRVQARRVGTLTSPIQDAAAAPASTTGRSVALLAGLSASDSSTNSIRVADSHGDRTTGTLPSALHDAAAAFVGGADYLFGGGDGIYQHAEIYRVDTTGGAAH